MITEQQDPRQQQIEDLLKHNNHEHKNKGRKTAYLWKTSVKQDSPTRNPLASPANP